MSELDLANFATGLADHENASASYCPCGKYMCILLVSELQYSAAGASDCVKCPMSSCNKPVSVFGTYQDTTDNV